MSNVVSTVANINASVVAFAPAAMAGIQAAEQSSASGVAKKQAVLDGILAGAKAGEAISIPQVAAVAAMIDLFVSIFNSLGLFSHKAK